MYSLKDDKLVWRQHYADIPKERHLRLTPLIIGKDRVYSAWKTSSHGYDLVALKLQTGERIYRTPLIAKISMHDDGRLEGYRRVALDLIRLDTGDELIIQFNSDRLVSWSVERSGSFSIINGADGQVIQRVDYDGLGCPRIAKSTSTSFTLASEGSQAPDRCSDVVILQTFSRQPDGSFLRTAVRVVTVAAWTVYAGTVVIHPLTLQAFSIVAGNHAPKALTLVPNRDPDDCRKMQKWWPHVTVDEYYRVAAARPLTLPPRKRRRRQFNGITRWNYACLFLPDERRVVFDHTGSKDDALYLFDFTPEY